MIKRIYDIEKMLIPGKVLIIYGARQVGKTTLVEDFLRKTHLKYRIDNGDSLKIAEIFSSRDKETILDYAEGYELVVIDEAQKIPGIGLGLKILVDNRKDLRVLVTGSSSFELLQNVGDSLTGRKRVYRLYPFSQGELLSVYNKSELRADLEKFLIFGSYPEVVTTQTKREKISAVEEIADSYLLRDVLALNKIRKPAKLIKMLRLLAHQIGSEVSMSEIGTNVGLDKQTVEEYVDILEKAFVLKYIGGFSGNLRKEVTRNGKVYFCDTGVRNAIINNYNPLDNRSDAGKLWENFLMMERIKRNEYKRVHTNQYFWRTYDRKEIDLVEERDGKLYGYEFKWNTRKLPKAPRQWLETYDNATYEVITPENYLEFIT